MSCHQEKNCCGTSECSTEKKCPVKCLAKILMNTIIFAVISSGIQYLIWQNLFLSEVMADDVAHLWRTQDAPEWKLLPLVSIVTGFLFSIIFCTLFDKMQWCSAPSACKGAKLGFLLALIPAISGSLMFYLTQPITPLIAFANFCEYFFTFTIAGGVLGGLKSLCNKKCNAEEDKR